MKKEGRQRKRAKAKLSGRDRMRMEQLRELVIVSARVIESQAQQVDDLREELEELRKEVNWIEEQAVDRNVFGYTEEQANGINRIFHMSDKNAKPYEYVSWKFADYLDEYRKLVRKVRQLEYAMPYDRKAAMPDLDAGPPGDKPSDPVMDLFSLDK